MLAGLSPDVRQLLAKQVKDARVLPSKDVPAMISTQPQMDEETTGNAGPGPSTIRSRSRSEGEEGELRTNLPCGGRDLAKRINICEQSSTEPASKRRKTNPTTMLPTGEIIKSSWDASDLVKRFTVENWEEEMPEDIKKCKKPKLPDFLPEPKTHLAIIPFRFPSTQQSLLPIQHA